MTAVKIAYQDFKNSKQQTRIINGKLYFRIIWSDYLEIKGRDRGVLSIAPSPDMPKSKDVVYQDENGNHFVFGGFHFLRFNGDIPKWYFNCGECSMEWQEAKDIGKYLTVIE